MIKIGQISSLSCVLLSGISMASQADESLGNLPVNQPPANSLWFLFIIFLIVSVFGVMALWWLRRQHPKRRGDAQLELLEVMVISPRSRLVRVRYGSRELLLAESAGATSLLESRAHEGNGS